MADLPRVLQYNKRDLPGVFPTELLRRELNPSGYPDVEASAINNLGVMESLESIARQVMDKLERGQQLPNRQGSGHDHTDSLSY